MKPTSINIRFLLELTVSFIILSHSIKAATLYWDGGSTNIGTDGNGLSGGTAGTWNNSLLNWDQGSSLAHISWTNANTDTAVFGGAAGIVTLGSSIDVGGLTFNTTGYVITTTGFSLNFAAANNTILFNNIAAATITGPVGGTGNVILAASNPATAANLTLNGISSGGWSGTTTVGPGTTLSLSSSNQNLRNTSGITLNGGGITLTNANNTEGALDRVAAVGITSNGGTITYTNTAAGTAYAETLGALALTRGQLNIVSTNAVTSGTQTLTLGSGSLTHAASNTSAITFSGASLGLNARNSIIITGESATAVGGIIGPWATWGTTAAAQTDYASYNITGGVTNAFGIQNANIAATAENSGSWVGGANVTLSGATTLTATRTVNSLRYSGSAQSLALGASNFNLETYGILNGGSGLLTISSAGTGGLTTPTGGGNLYLTSGSNAITVSAAINDNTGAVTLVKNGAGTLTLSSTTSNFSGGIVLNAGQINFNNNANLGSGGGITVNGTATIDGGDQYSLARTLTINDGALLTLSNGFGVTGVFSGNGALNVTSADDFNFTNAANTYTGAITSSTGGTTNYGLTFTSIGDTAGAGVINLAGNGGTFRWTSASGSTTTLANRQFALSSTGVVGSNMTTISALGTTAASNLVISKDLLVTGTAGARALRLAGTNTGNNTFAGRITDGTDGGTSVVTLVKEQAGTWILSGANTYSGTTTITLGTLIASSTNNLGDGSATNTLIFNGGTLQAGGSISSPSARGVTMTGAGTINTNGNAVSIAGVVSGAGALTKSATTGTLTLSGVNSYTGAITISGGTLQIGGSGNLGLSAHASTISIASGATLQYSSSSAQGLAGVISGAGSLIKDTGSSTLTLTGANTYSGGTTVSAGNLILASSGSHSSSGTVTVAGGTLTIGAGAGGRTLSNSMVLSGGTVLGGQDNIGSGGRIVVDSNGVTHIFTSGGSLVLPTAVTANALVVGGGGGAGGGVGGTVYQAGGGGGQVMNLTSQALSGTTVVTVGAGGAGANNANATNGGVTSLGGTSAAGGLGATITPGGTGGTSGSGNLGGTRAGTQGAGGGGGDSSAGSNGISNAQGGAGGAGTAATTISGLVNYGYGQNSGGSAYFGGGGGGGSSTSAGAGGLGGGGTASVGTSNTGGGGGSGTAAGSAGGSGIVVVQYAYGLTAGTVTLSGAIDLQAASTLDANASGGLINVTNVISTSAGSGGLTIASSSSAGGVVQFGSSNTYVGNTTINSGAILRLNTANAMPFGSGKGNVAVTGTLDLNGNSSNINGLSGNGIVDGTSGTTTFTVGNNNATSTFDGVIKNTAGSLALSKTGNGSLTLTSTNTYTGATNVTSGTLVVNGSISTSSLTTVASGATIGGSGTVGALTVSLGGSINPGNSPGILTVSGNYTQAGAYNVEITGLTAGSGHDQINVTSGTVDIIAGASLNALFSGSYAANDLIFILLNNDTDAITGTYSGLIQGATVTSYGGFNWKISYIADSASTSFTGGNDIALRAEAIPEPRAALLGCLGVLLLLRRRR